MAICLCVSLFCVCLSVCLCLSFVCVCVVGIDLWVYKDILHDPLTCLSQPHACLPVFTPSCCPAQQIFAFYSEKQALSTGQLLPVPFL